MHRHIDANKTRYVDSLREAVAIKSVSAWPNSRPDVGKMIDFVAEKLKTLGAEVQLTELGTQILADGQIISLPKAILASLGNVCIAISIYFFFIDVKENLFDFANKNHI